MGTAINNGVRDRAGNGRGTATRSSAASARRASASRHAPGYGNGRAEGEGLATFLGWFSLGLGLAELIAPGTVARLIGVRNDDRSREVLRAMGLREVTSGVGILANPTSSRWMWSRVGGDALDLSLLGTAMRSDETERGRTAAAIAAVLGVAALDVVAAQRLARTSDDAGDHIPVTHSITVNKPVEEVYRFWHDFENLPRFMRHLESVESLPNGRTRWRAKAPAGKSVEWEAEITEDRANEVIAWRSVEGSDVDNSGEVRFRPAPGDRGTEVTVRLEYDPPAGKLGATIAKLFREEPGQQVQDDLRSFKQVMEIGEVLLSDATARRGPHPAQPISG